MAQGRPLIRCIFHLRLALKVCQKLDEAFTFTFPLLAPTLLCAPPCVSCRKRMHEICMHTNVKCWPEFRSSSGLPADSDLDSETDSDSELLPVRQRDNLMQLLSPITNRTTSHWLAPHWHCTCNCLCVCSVSVSECVCAVLCVSIGHVRLLAASVFVTILVSLPGTGLNYGTPRECGSQLNKIEHFTDF